MTLDLLNIPTHVLTLKGSDHRINNFKKNIGSHLAVKTFYGEKFPTVAEGCLKSTYSLYQTVTPPVLILEDDINITSDFCTTLIDVPENADALYLGTSAWGIKNNNSSFKNINIEKYNQNFYKIEYMTSTHAILFLSKSFWSKMMNILSDNINKSPIEPLDVHIGRLHSQFNVYAVAKPLFYQDNQNEYLTKYPAESIYLETMN